jgi:hypothetical protein
MVYLHQQREETMKKTKIALALFTVTLLIQSAAKADDTTAQSQVLTGDQADACSAIICLSTGQPPSECTPSLQRYFSISYEKIEDTIQGREDFLSLCPSANSTPQMSALTQAIANGAGRCDAASLNQELAYYVADSSDYGHTEISSVLPSYCSAYLTNSYTQLSSITPTYYMPPPVQNCDGDNGCYTVQPPGYWVNP